MSERAEASHADASYTQGGRNPEIKAHGQTTLELPDEDISSVLFRRVNEISAGKLLTPRAYSIEGYVLSSLDLKILMSSDKMRGYRLGEIPQNLEAYRLEVNSYNQLILDRKRTTSHLEMIIIGDTATNAMRLHRGGFSCRVQLGGNHFGLDYKETSIPSVAVLKRVSPLHRVKSYNYGNGDPFSAKEIKELELAKKGFPPEVDWGKTFIRYVTQTNIDTNGEITPLTGKDIHGQTLIPANPPKINMSAYFR